MQMGGLVVTYAVESDTFQSDLSHEFCGRDFVALGCGDFVEFG